jgi:hypothetical protein
MPMMASLTARAKTRAISFVYNIDENSDVLPPYHTPEDLYNWINESPIYPPVWSGEPLLLVSQDSGDADTILALLESTKHYIECALVEGVAMGMLHGR